MFKNGNANLHRDEVLLSKSVYYKGKKYKHWASDETIQDIQKADMIKYDSEQMFVIMKTQHWWQFKFILIADSTQNDSFKQ